MSQPRTAHRPPTTAASHRLLVITPALALSTPQREQPWPSRSLGLRRSTMQQSMAVNLSDGAYNGCGASACSIRWLPSFVMERSMAAELYNGYGALASNDAVTLKSSGGDARRRIRGDGCEASRWSVRWLRIFGMLNSMAPEPSNISSIRVAANKTLGSLTFTATKRPKPIKHLDDSWPAS